MLRDLLPSTMTVHTEGSLEVDVSRLAYDSRVVTPGTLFFALPGKKADGSHFIAQALTHGACAVVAPSHISLPQLATEGRSPPCTLVTCAAPRRLLGLVADQFYRQPTAQLTVVGVTGTSGKTTTTYILESIWQAMDWSAGVIGTVNYRYAGKECPAPFTTPEAVELQELLSEMVTHQVSHVAMEASSHALAQERVAGCRWNGAVFTNLSRDHLDFHRDLEEYFAVKARLFLDGLAASDKPERFAVINADDPWGTRLLAQPLPGRVLTYGLQSDVTVSAHSVEQTFAGLRGILRLGEEEVAFTSRLIGDPHLYNIMAAAAVAYALGVPVERIARGIAQCVCVPGRLEAIDVGQPFGVFVDYAHKPEALATMLRSVRQLTGKRVITVFGCGGDRDRGKRPFMGVTAGRLSDIVVLTSDNPRTEDPWSIITETEPGLIEAGMKKIDDPTAIATLQQGYLIMTERRAAIRSALAGAQPDDVVIIAGKGHEDYQIIGTTKHHFDDREEVRSYLSVMSSKDKR